LKVGPYHTNTVAGLQLAMDMLRRKRNTNKQIFMITDGKPSCVREKDGSYYLVKLKSIDASPLAAVKKDQPMDYFKQIMERQKSYESFQGWMDQLRKTASITINEKVISQ
jgi:uncharacterized protein with von Willebrand factor type A (vWA) domain